VRKDKGTPHTTPARPAPKVKINERAGHPTECQVWVGDVCVFDGVSREALVKAKGEVVNPKVQELLPNAQIPLMFQGQQIPFHVMNISFDTSRGITAILESGPLRTTSPPSQTQRGPTLSDIDAITDI
jgi:hypothetical protein